jgi:hypothetical protein
MFLAFITDGQVQATASTSSVLTTRGASPNLIKSLLGLYSVSFTLFSYVVLLMFFQRLLFTLNMLYLAQKRSQITLVQIQLQANPSRSQLFQLSVSLNQLLALKHLPHPSPILFKALMHRHPFSLRDLAAP